MKQLRVGIVGAGMAADFHVACLRRVYGVDVQLAGVTSLRPESRRQFGESRNIPVFASLEAMLDHVDLVDICSPPAVHKQGMLLALQAGKHLIVEKPLTGFFGPVDDESFRGDRYPKEHMLAEVLATLQEIAAAVQPGQTIGYAENFIYGPALQKEREVLQHSQGQILRMLGEESHNGSHSPVYGIWHCAGAARSLAKGAIR